MRNAFTLIELMIVIAIIAIIAAIAIPNLLESRITANESGAAASLKSGLFPAQVAFQSGAYSDFDGNGRGEYATDHQYLAGAVSAVDPVAVTGVTLRPLSLMAPNFNVADGVAVGAYKFRVDVAIALSQNTGDQIANESYFGAYAVPNVPDTDGRRCFAINQSGLVYATGQGLFAATPADMTLVNVSYAPGNVAAAIPPAAPVITPGLAGNANYNIFNVDPTTAVATIAAGHGAIFQK